MSDKSPLFISSLELIAHASEIYLNKQPKKFKFVILHLANAVELILKDKLIDEGVSIYNKNSETIHIWKAFELLESKGITVAERPLIELLIDDRNNIQHRYGYPSPEAVYYYLEKVISFFTGFLAEHYNVNFAEALSLHLSPDSLLVLGLFSDDPFNFYKLMDISPESAIIDAYSRIDDEFGLIFRSITGWRNDVIRKKGSIYLPRLINMLVQDKILPPTVSAESYLSLRDMRNRVAHGMKKDYSPSEWKQALDIATQIIKGLRSSAERKYYTRENIQKLLQEGSTS
jgi:uncharacterized protein YutE (UPF0331/DUF86 family)